MSEFAGANLSRLMAAAGLTVQDVAEQTGLDIRTIRGVLGGTNKPHARSLHRLAEGLNVSVDEFFLDPAQLLARCFDHQSNPVVAEVIEEHKELFAGWTEADFDELHSRVGAGGALTRDGTIAAVQAMNRNREVHEKLALLMDSSHAELVAGIVDAMYERVLVDEGE